MREKDETLRTWLFTKDGDGKNAPNYLFLIKGTAEQAKKHIQYMVKQGIRMCSHTIDFRWDPEYDRATDKLKDIEVISDVPGAYSFHGYVTYSKFDYKKSEFEPYTVHYNMTEVRENCHGPAGLILDDKGDVHSMYVHSILAEEKTS